MYQGSTLCQDDALAKLDNRCQTYTVELVISSTRSQTGIVHFALLALVTIVGIVAVLFASGRLSLPSPTNLKQSLGKSSVLKSTVFTVRSPNSIKDKAVSAKISAKDGGVLKLTDEKGIEAMLTIPAGSLKRDTTLTLSPLSEVPLANYTSSLTNGILIEPVDTQFDPPAALTFNFKPGTNQSSLPGGSSATQQNTKSPDQPQVLDQESRKNIEEAKKYIEQLHKSGQALGIQEPTATPTPPGSSDIFSPSNQAGIIHVNPSTNGVGLTPSTTSSDGNRINTPVSEGGAYSPDNITPEKAGNQVSNAAGNIGLPCSNAQVQGLATALGHSGNNPDLGKVQTQRGAIKDCVDNKINDLEWKCKNDRIKVRRKDFEAYQKISAAFFGNTDRAQWLKDLEKTCTGQYKIGGYGANGPSSFSIEAAVCGFVDDKWTGKDKFHIQVDVAFLDYGGNNSFKPPSYGGNFQVLGQGNVNAGGPGVGMSFGAAGPDTLDAYFDNAKTFTFTVPNVTVQAPIILMGNSCSASDKTLPPLEPIVN